MARLIPNIFHWEVSILLGKSTARGHGNYFFLKYYRSTKK